MEKVYIMGHRNPDTDSVTSAIALEYLKKKLGMDARASVLGEINKETKYVLDYFKIKTPSYLNDVKLQIKDVTYHKNCYLNEKCSVMDAYNYMTENSITGVPLVDDNDKLAGLITLKAVAKDMVKGNFNNLCTSYGNIVNALEGEEILKFDEEIKGNIMAASFRSTTFVTSVNLTKDDILIVGDRHSIIEHAVKSGIKLLILVGDAKIKDMHLEIAKSNKVNIIKTKLDTFHVSKLIGFSNYAIMLNTEDIPVVFDENDYYNDFISLANKLGYNNYPVIDKNNTCKGLIRITDITEKQRKKVILVDHNEIEQSVVGLDEAEILEIVDHHKIGNISTSSPINFRNMSVGSTNTIIYQLYLENKIDIPHDIAGIMLSGILSDTLCLTSPTTTEIDKSTVKALAEIANVDYEKYALDMFKAGTSLEGKTIEEIVNSDIKAFHTDNSTFAVSQVFTLDYEKILNDKEKYINMIEELKVKKEYDFVLLAVTDIIKNGSYIFYTSDLKEKLEVSFGKDNFEQGTYIEGCVSRKKQIVPVLMDFLK